LIPKKRNLLVWNQGNWCTFDSMVRNKGYKTCRTGHVTIKPTSFCATLHCTNYPQPPQRNVRRQFWSVRKCYDVQLGRYWETKD